MKTTTIIEIGALVVLALICGLVLYYWFTRIKKKMTSGNKLVSTIQTVDPPDGPIQITSDSTYTGSCDDVKYTEAFVQYGFSQVDPYGNESDKLTTPIYKILSQTNNTQTTNTQIGFNLSLKDQNYTVNLYRTFLPSQVYANSWILLKTFDNGENIVYKDIPTNVEKRSTVNAVPPFCQPTYKLKDREGNIYPTPS